MAPTIQTSGAGTPSEKRTPSTHSTPVPPRPAERKSELVCRVKYNNTLPDIPFDCKFIAYPFESTRFIEYKSTSLERNYKYEVLTEHDLGVTIDLINKDTYAPNYNIQLDPADEKLLEEDTLTPQDSKRSRHHARSVSWLRRTEYISTEQTRFQPQVMDKVEAKVGFSIKKNFKEDNLYMDRDSQVKAIEKTFADTKLPIEKHYSKPNVVPVEIMPVYPDFKYWKYPCAQVIFDSDPAPQGRPVPAQIEEMSQAMIRGVMDESGEQFVAYFLPTTETLDKRKLDVLSNVEYTDEQEYEYKMAREYNWNVKSKSCKGYEENYFLIVRDDAVYYNELETRVRLSKRRQKVGAAPNNTRLVVTHRPLNATEFRIQRLRERFLEPPNEEEEEEEEEEDEEEEEATQQPTQEEGGGDQREGGEGEENKRTSDTEDKHSSKHSSRASSRSKSGSPASRRSRSKSGSPAASHRSKSGSPAGSHRSKSGSPASRRSRSKSGSPAGSHRSKSGSPASRTSKSRSPAGSDRSKSGSPAASPASRRSRSKSGTPASRRSRSKSGSPAGSEASRRSQTPASRRSRSKSGSPADSHRSKSGSPASRRSKSGSPATSRRSSRSARSGSAGSEKSARSGKSPASSVGSRSSRSPSPAASNKSGVSRRSRSKSAAPSERSRSGSPAATSDRSKSKSRSRSGSPAGSGSGGSSSGSGSGSDSD